MDSEPVASVAPGVAMPQTILELLADRAGRIGILPAILSWQRAALNYQDLHLQALRIRRQLRALAIGPKDRVALVLPNGPEMAVAFLGVAASAACAPLNPLYREAEFDFFLEDLDPRAILVSAGQATPARTVAERRGIRIVDVIANASSRDGEIALDAPAGHAADDRDPPEPDDVALILHTSGTTARPKMVPLSQRNLCASAAHIAATLGLSTSDRCLNVMPLFHIHGLIGAVLSSLSAGASVFCAPGFLVRDFGAWLAQARPTWYTAVPTMHQAILAHARESSAILKRAPLRFIRSSSSPLPPPVMEELERVLGAPVIEAYGMTEASHQIASNPIPPGIRKPGSVGLPAGPQVAVVSESDSSFLAAGNTGEVVIRGASVTDGYLGNPEANARSFTDGWFRTGDQGYIDQDGYLFLTGRLKELINRGGEKISPREIDEALLRHPAVEQALAFGMPDTRLGEEVAAAVVLRDGDGATEQELRRFVAGRLAHFKVPRRIVILDALPKGPTGKPQRIGLAQKLALPEAQTEESPDDVIMPAATETERALQTIWSELLQVAEPGVTQRFRDLGGDSMTAMLLVSRVSAEFMIDIELLDLFDAPTIRAQAELIDSMRSMPGDAHPRAHEQS